MRCKKCQGLKNELDKDGLCEVCSGRRAATASDVIAGATRRVLGFERLRRCECLVKGCTEKRALEYGVCIDGEPLRLQVPFCSGHGAEFLIRTGELFGELLKGKSA